jgi:hypothetical protein
MLLRGNTLYINKRTRKRVTLLKRVRPNDMLYVKYESGMKCWFSVKDFERLFEKY